MIFVVMHGVDLLMSKGLWRAASQRFADFAATSA
jgi:hypothetical protein